MHDLIMSELFNRPHLVEAGRLDALAAYVLSRGGFDIKVPDQAEPMAFAGSDSAVWNENGYFNDAGVAIIDMVGTMVHRASGMQAMSGIVGYTNLSRRFKRAMNDSQVHAIFINGDTPGGAVNGAFDFSDLIYSARGMKPVYTLAADRLCSAGILVGSSAEKVYTTQTGQVGSIGVVMKHMDISKWSAKTGINSTYIYAGDHKIDGNPDSPLSKEAHKLFQAEVEQLYSMFVNVVERNTDLTSQQIIDTQAAVYLGADAVDAGLAVEVITGDQLLENMKTEFGTGRPYLSPTTTMETQTMSVENEDKPAKTAEKKGGEAEAAVTVKSTADAGGKATVVAEQPAAGAGDQTEKTETQMANDRFTAIMQSDEAKGRHAAAVRLAQTSMSAEDVIATLKDLPVHAATPSKLDAAMQAAGGGAGVGAEGEAGDPPDSQKILSSYRLATGTQA